MPFRSRKDPWYLGDVDLSKLEGLDTQRAERVKAYLVGGEKRYQEEKLEDIEKRLLLEQQTLAERLTPQITDLVKDSEAQEKLDDAAELNKTLSHAIDESNAKISRALSTAIQAIHDIEGDESYESDDLIMTIAYLAALQDPQD